MSEASNTDLNALLHGIKERNLQEGFEITGIEPSFIVSASIILLGSYFFSMIRAHRKREFHSIYGYEIATPETLTIELRLLRIPILFFTSTIITIIAWFFVPPENYMIYLPAASTVGILFGLALCDKFANYRGDDV